MATNTDQSGTMYDLTNVLDIEALESVRPGSNILISGPAMTGKDDLAYEILADGTRQGQGAVIVSTGDRADNVIANFRDRTGTDAVRLGVVDCVSDSANDGSGDGIYVHHVSSPGDLTGIGIGITKALEGLHESGAQQGRLALSSLSTMLTYTDRKTVFQILSRPLIAAGRGGVSGPVHDRFCGARRADVAGHQTGVRRDDRGPRTGRDPAGTGRWADVLAVGVGRSLA